MTLMAIGAAAGLAKSELVDRPKEERQRKLAAATQRYSPWTGLQAQGVQEADPLGSSIAFGGAGYQMGLGAENQSVNRTIADSMVAKNAAEMAAMATPKAMPQAGYAAPQSQYSLMGANPWGGVTSPYQLQQSLVSNYGY